MSVKSFKELKRVFSKNPNLYKADGADHIRISPYGKTELGKWLSPEYSRKVTIPHLGEFASVRNLWIWLTTEGHPDQIRSVNPKDLERWVKSTKVKKGDSLPYFTELIGYAKYQQLVQHKPRLEDTGMALLVYQESKEGFRTSMPYEQWYVSMAKNAMESYLAGRKPLFFVENQEVDIEAYLRNDILTDLFNKGEDEEVAVQEVVIEPRASRAKARPNLEEAAVHVVSTPEVPAANEEQPPAAYVQANTLPEPDPALEEQPPAQFRQQAFA